MDFRGWEEALGQGVLCNATELAETLAWRQGSLVRALQHSNCGCNCLRFGGDLAVRVLAEVQFEHLPRAFC